MLVTTVTNNKKYKTTKTKEEIKAKHPSFTTLGKDLWGDANALFSKELGKLEPALPQDHRNWGNRRHTKIYTTYLNLMPKATCVLACLYVEEKGKGNKENEKHPNSF